LRRRWRRRFVKMVTFPELRDALLSHLAYEEDELLEPLGHSSITL
jgi:hypothetical protein